MTSQRAAVLGELAQLIVNEVRGHPLRVGIDGRDAAGKTTLADELAPLVEARGRPVIRASIDGFHRPRAERYRRGRESPLGYYLDSFDYDAVRRELLLPLGRTGKRVYRSAVFDATTDSPVAEERRVASEDAVALVDGIFLFRPELDDLWDFRIFVDVTVEEAERRDAARDAAAGRVRTDASLRLFATRYAQGQEIYFDAEQPKARADVVVENDIESPRLIVGERLREPPAGGTLELPHLPLR